jgi:hypothetical protein
VTKVWTIRMDQGIVNDLSLEVIEQFEVHNFIEKVREK